jgi:tetratricopeptide (TPR) repeat protein
MKTLTKSIISAIFILAAAGFALAQVQLPRESNGAIVSQTVGDTKITVIYHRPNAKGRKVWGELVPYGQVWRMGANDNTTFEVTNDVTINGQKLPAGKYGLHAIPQKTEWTIIFNKVNNEWGSFRYDEKQDALRVKVMPTTITSMRETMMFEFETVGKSNTNLVLSWEMLRIPLTIDVGDVNGRVLTQLREAAKDETAKTYRQTLMSGANFVLAEKLTANYEEALGWVEKAIKLQENYGALRLKALLLAQSGKTKEAIPVAERALELGKASTPPANADSMKSLEAEIAKWKAKK